MYERKPNWISIISAFAIGGLIGAAAALLMAPHSGEEIRSLIRDKGNELKDRAAETADETKSRVSKSIEDISQQTKDKVSSLRDRGQELADDMKSH